MYEDSIFRVAEALRLPGAALEARCRGVVKVDPAQVRALRPEPRRGRVVLVTAMTPTPSGEGKTTTSIGLVDGLRRIGADAVGALREPSLGPLFGHKGGAVGGGRSQVTPGDVINMHFTGDLHAVTSAHNLLAAIADNHLYFGNEPALDPARLAWGRVLDMNDRALRITEVGREPESLKRGIQHTSRFDITAASEVMAVLCMSRDLSDLRARLDRLLVGLGVDGRPVSAADLGAGGAMAALLLDAARPNLVQTLEGSPVFIHGGPFANIAQGTSTVMATQLAREVADIVVTEAGFAFDLGGFKFLDLKGRAAGLRPAAVVLVVTVRALRYHGGVSHGAAPGGPDLHAVLRGLENVGAHLGAMQRLGLSPPLIAINRFPDDSAEELAAVKDYAAARGALAVESTHFADGGAGATELSRALLSMLRDRPEDSPGYTSPYSLEQPLRDKLSAVTRVVLGGAGAVLGPQAEADLAALAPLGIERLPVCLAKTHLSISDDKKVQGRPEAFTLHVTRLRASMGAGFVVALCGDILTMPGLPKAPAAANVDIVPGPEASGGGYHIKGLR